MLSHEEAVDRLIRIGRRMSDDEAREFALAMFSNPQKSANLINLMLGGRPLTDDEVLEIMRSLPRQLASMGEG